jgi:hypothetical protein
MEHLFEDDGFGQYIIKDDVSHLRRNHYLGGGLIFGKVEAAHSIELNVEGFFADGNFE